MATSSLYVYEVCNKAFSAGFNLNKHRKKQTATETIFISSKADYKLNKCVLFETMVPKKDLYLHFESEHHITISSSRHRFENMQVFFVETHYRTRSSLLFY